MRLWFSAPLSHGVRVGVPVRVPSSIGSLAFVLGIIFFGPPAALILYIVVRDSPSFGLLLAALAVPFVISRVMHSFGW